MQTWQRYANGYSGMVIAPTGFGKTFSVFLAVVIDYLNHPESYPKWLKTTMDKSVALIGKRPSQSNDRSG
jgi:Lhr-like helicase